jgi:hypothetical protein
MAAPPGVWATAVPMWAGGQSWASSELSGLRKILHGTLGSPRRLEGAVANSCTAALTKEATLPADLAHPVIGN